MSTYFPALAHTKAQEVDSCFEKVASEYDEDFDSLDDDHWWRDRYGLFESRGFQVSAKCRPGLGIFNQHTVTFSGWYMIDAVRLSDGKPVMIKKVPYRPGSQEVPIATMLSSPENLNDQRNHCISVLDSFHDTIDDPRLVFLVMPKLRSCNDLRFGSVGEVIEFMRQTLEALEFMHGRDIAHRDIVLANFMVDSDSSTPELQSSASEKLETKHVRYRICNFDSCQISSPTSIRKSAVDITNHQKHSPTHPDGNDDPFARDVFALGTLFKNNFVTPYSNFDTLIPLINQMTARDPKKRLSMAVARSRFETLVRNWNGSTLRWRLRPTHEKFGPRVTMPYPHVLTIIDRGSVQL